MNASEWLDTYGVTFDWSATGYHADADGWEHHRFTVSLTSGETVLTAVWRQGLGIESDPTPAAVLPALSSDAASGELTWPEFAGEFGYDEHDAPLSQYRTWEACRDWRGQLEDFCSGAGADMLPDFLEIREVSD